MATKSAMKTAYHIKDGPTVMYEVDARSAAARHPKEWSLTPWTKHGDKKQPVGVEIPENWQDLPGTGRINIALQLGEERKGLTAAKADEVIEAEVERRKAEAEAEAAEADDE